MTDFFPTLTGDPARRRLQRLIWEAPLNAEALFFHRQTTPEGGLRLSTETYFNLFFQKRWAQLTDLTDFALAINPFSTGRLRIFSHSGPSGPRLQLDQFIEAGPQSFPLTAKADFHFFDWSPSQPEAPWPQAEYTAERRLGPEAKPRIALISATFERNDDIRRTVAVYEQARTQFPEIERLTHFYVINNQLGDAEKLAGLASDKVTLINNPVNTGGAGGFDLGARKAVDAGTFSHVLFMDDDIVIHPESWLRSLSLISGLTPRYQGRVLSGSMFLRERPNFCQVIHEALDQKAKQVLLAGQEDLANPDQARNELLKAAPDWGRPAEPPRRPYAAWWYCLMPISVFHDYGYLLPVFFRGDDQEFGLRINREVMSLNGVCVWHPNLSAKRNLLRVYLGFRNKSLIRALHCHDWKKLVWTSFAKRLARCLAANDYAEAAAVNLALRDFSRFPQKQATGPEIIQSLNYWLERFPNIEEDRPAAVSVEPGSPKKLWGPALGVLLSLGGALRPRWSFRPGPVQAERRQIRGKFPALAVQEPIGPSRKFQRGPALRLSLWGLKNLLGLIFFSPGLSERLRKLIEFPARPKTES